MKHFKDAFQQWFSMIDSRGFSKEIPFKMIRLFLKCFWKDLFKWNFSETILKIRKILAKNSVVWEWFEKVMPRVVAKSCCQELTQWIVLRDCSERIVAKDCFESLLPTVHKELFLEIIANTHFKWIVLRVSKNDFEKWLRKMTSKNDFEKWLRKIIGNTSFSEHNLLAQFIEHQ